MPQAWLGLVCFASQTFPARAVLHRQILIRSHFIFFCFVLFFLIKTCLKLKSSSLKFRSSLQSSTLRVRMVKST